MKTRLHTPLRPATPGFGPLSAGAMLIVSLNGAVQAADFTWNGTVNTWPSVNWLDSSSVLVAGGTGAVPADIYTIPGGTVNFTDHDTFGNAGANPALTINVNAAILSNEDAAFGKAFTTVGLLNLNSGTVTSTGGANASFQAFQFKNTVNSTGASLISTLATPAEFNGFHVTNNTFNVTSGTLTVSAPLINAPAGAAAGFTKSGAGTMTLSAVNGFTGNLLVNGGILEVASGGSLTNNASITTRSGGRLDIGGSVTLGANQYLAAGNGLSETTGEIRVVSGGSLTLGNGAFLIGGSTSGNNQYGSGTFTQTGGTVTVPLGGGTGPDTTNVWLNPYGTTGRTATLNLDGGTFTTSRAIANGSGGTAVVNLNGGTLRTGIAMNVFAGAMTVSIRNGGAIFDTNGVNSTVDKALLHSITDGDNAIDGGLTKSGAGTMTLTSNGSTYTGNVLVNEGTLALQTGLNGPAPASTGLGNPNTPGRTVTVAAGATLQFRQHDQLGNDVATPQMSIIVNGGTVAAATGSQGSGNGPFNTLPAVTLSGGTLTSANGAFPAVQSFSLKGDVTVTGSAPSTINTTGTPALLNGIHLSKAGGVNFNVADVTGSSAVDLTVSAPLISGAVGGLNAGPGLLNKQGTGTLALTTANTYTGATTVQAGTLALSGSGSVASTLIDVQVGGTFDVSAVAFSLGGTQTLKANGLVTGGVTTTPGSVVMGSGTIDGNLSIGGNLSPGNSPGTLTLTNDELTFGSVSTGTFELGGTSASSYDRVTGINTLTLDGTITIAYFGGFNPSAGNSFDLFDFTSVNAAGFDVSTDLVLPALDPGLSWDTSAFAGTGLIAVVPEPAPALLGVLTILGLSRRRR